MTDEPQDFEATEAEPIDADAQDFDDAGDTEADGGDAPAAKAWTPEDEEEARLFGWKSPNEWQGEKPPGYIDNPQDFLGRVKRSRIFQTMEEKMSEQERKLAAMNDQALERQRREYEGRMQALTARQRRAVEEADTETWDKLEKQRQQMMQDAPQPDQPQRQEPPAEVAEYQKANDWAKDPVLWREAVEVVNVGLESGAVRGDDPKGQLEFAERTMRAKYPHMFQQAKPQQRQRVDGGGLGSGSPAGGRSTFDKLPGDAKSAFERFVSRGVFSDTKKDREEYAREYNNA